MSKSTKNTLENTENALKQLRERTQKVAEKANELNDGAKAFNNSAKALNNKLRAEEAEQSKILPMIKNFLKALTTKTKVGAEVSSEETSRDTIDLNPESNAIMSNNPTKDEVNNKIKSNSTQDKNDQNLNSGSMWDQIKKVAKYIYQIPSKAMQYASNMFSPKTNSDIADENRGVSSNQQIKTKSQDNNRNLSLKHDRVSVPNTPSVAKVSDKNKGHSKF